MALLVSGLVVFLGIHIVPMSPPLKQAIVRRIGEGSYKLAFSVLSGVGLLLIIVGFGQFRGSHQDVQLWSPPLWSRHFAFALMLPAFILLVAAYTPSQIRAWAGGTRCCLG